VVGVCPVTGAGWVGAAVAPALGDALADPLEATPGAVLAARVMPLPNSCPLPGPALPPPRA
jgi:hypothetical protein